MALWSLGLAIWATVILIVCVIGMAGASSREDQEAFGVMIGGLVFIPTLIGIALGVGSLDRRLGNPPLMWIGAIWNGAMVAIFVLLSVIGILSGG